MSYMLYMDAAGSLSVYVIASVIAVLPWIFTVYCSILGNLMMLVGKYCYRDN